MLRAPGARHRGVHPRPRARGSHATARGGRGVRGAHAGRAGRGGAGRPDARAAGHTRGRSARPVRAGGGPPGNPAGRSRPPRLAAGVLVPRITEEQLDRLREGGDIVAALRELAEGAADAAGRLPMIVGCALIAATLVGKLRVIFGGGGRAGADRSRRRLGGGGLQARPHPYDAGGLGRLPRPRAEDEGDCIGGETDAVQPG